MLDVLVDEGLGNSSYLLDLGDGRALAVDPPRDLRAMRAAAARRGTSIAWVADTHLHADFLSGAVQLAHDDGATILASHDRLFPHRSLHDGDEVDLGGLTLRALGTPGHTDEHLSYLILDGSIPMGVFTGGSLIVGAAARTDLLGAERTIELAHAQYRSLRRLAELPSATQVWPTHGVGSFCSAPAGSARTSTIGAEKAGNALLSAPSADAFAELLTAGLGSYPSYFTWLADVNRRGPSVVASPPVLNGLSFDRVLSLVNAGAMVLDVRPIADVAKGHIPGAVSIALRPQFATWLGWVVDPSTPLIVVRNEDQDPADILWPAYNIGYTNFAGELSGGMAAWSGPVSTAPLVAPSDVGPRVIDVRQESEWQAGHLPQAIHLELGSLQEQLSDVDGGPTVVMCGHGERAMTAATLLQRAGHPEVSVLQGGARDWARATGQTLA